MNKKVINKKKLSITIILLFLIVVFVFYIIRQQNRSVNTPIVIQSKISLKEAQKEINSVNAQKALLLLSGKEQEEELINIAQKSLKAWEVFVVEFKDNQPKEFERTRDWNRKLTAILEHERKANELTLEGELGLAKKENELAGEIYSKIKKENNILEISDEMLAFYKSIEKIISAEAREDIKKELPELKYNFTVLKEFNIDDKYNELIARLEEIISDLDKLLDGPDFRKAQAELEPVFMELYMGY